MAIQGQAPDISNNLIRINTGALFEASFIV
jgi:hypothetical protein